MIMITQHYRSVSSEHRTAEGIVSASKLSRDSDDNATRRRQAVDTGG